MKHMKRAAALFLALIMIMSLAVTAFATETPPTGKITIQGSATVPVTGKTFAAYKILDATMKDPADPSKGISYQVPSALKDFYLERYSIQNDAKFEQSVVEAIRAEMGKNPQKFAQEVLAQVKAVAEEGATDSSLIYKKTAKDVVGETAVLDGMPLGYYLVEDQGANTPISALMVHTNNNAASDGQVIKLKAVNPGLDKKIDGDQDTDASASGLVEKNNASIGDVVPFVIKTKVPDMTGYTKYYFVVNDTLSKGLTFDKDTVKIEIFDTEGSKKAALTAGEKDKKDYTVTATENEGSVNTVKIVFNSFYEYVTEGIKNNTFAVGDEIRITYSAKVNENAALHTVPNTNTAKLTFSNKPNVDVIANPDNPNEPDPDDKDKVTGESAESKTETYVTGIELTKIDGTSSERLTGAEFQITGNGVKTVLVKKDSFQKAEGTKGKYWELKDGSYTTTNPDSVENKSDYVDENVTYDKVPQTDTITQNISTDVKGTVGQDGVLRFDGLGAGKYTITELKAPDGYNKLTAPIEVTISWSAAEGWTVSEGATTTDNGITITVKNSSGSVLPETGGMGTTIFYVMGTMLVMASAALLVADRKRKQF